LKLALWLRIYACSQDSSFHSRWSINTIIAFIAVAAAQWIAIKHTKVIIIFNSIFLVAFVETLAIDDCISQGCPTCSTRARIREALLDLLKF